MNTRAAIANERPVFGAGRTSLDRRFFSFAGIVMLIVTAFGFQEFYLHGQEFGGTAISPSMFPFVIVHGVALTLWFVLFLTQSVLIANRRRQIHMTLGWSAMALAAIIVVSGFPVAIKSVQADPLSPFWGMEYRQFLLIMLTEIGSFALFVLAGVLNRKRPARHRAMMLLATMSILAGATLRMPILFPIFGTTGWVGMFGPVFVLGAVLLATRSVMLRTLDRWLAAGFAAMVASYVLAVTLATGESWKSVAHWAFEV
jgi:hypothetical protein